MMITSVSVLNPLYRELANRCNNNKVAIDTNEKMAEMRAWPPNLGHMLPWYRNKLI